jgi:hypothetical protein
MQSKEEYTLAGVGRATVSPNRGLKWTDHAVDFGRTFKPEDEVTTGTELTQDQFCEWAFKRQLLPSLPPEDCPKDSDEWLAHLQRRHIVRQTLNNAASHPRMRDYGVEPFHVHSIATNTLKVDSTSDSFQLAAAKVPTRQKSLFRRQKLQLKHLKESVDYTLLPPICQLQVDQIAGMLDDFDSEFAVKANNLERRFHALQHNIKLQVERGEITPKNGGIAGLLQAPSNSERWREYCQQQSSEGKQPTIEGFKVWLAK